jgi:hypothetical protein
MAFQPGDAKADGLLGVGGHSANGKIGQPLKMKRSVHAPVKSNHYSTKEEMYMPVKPSEREEEYFAKMEYENKRKILEEKHKELATGEKNRLKELHHMKCPKCGMELIEIDYKKTRIDRCSECKGIWLDAGELETVSKFERSTLDKLFSVFK